MTNRIHVQIAEVLPGVEGSNVDLYIGVDRSAKVWKMVAGGWCVSKWLAGHGCIRVEETTLRKTARAKALRYASTRSA